MRKARKQEMKRTSVHPRHPTPFLLLISRPPTLFLLLGLPAKCRAAEAAEPEEQAGAAEKRRRRGRFGHGELDREFGAG